MPDLSKTPFVMQEEEFEAFFRLAEQKPWLKERNRDEAVRHLLELCEYRGEVNLLLEMINRLKLIDTLEIRNFVDRTLEKIYEIPDFTHKNIAFVPKYKNNGTDSSLWILQILQNSFDPKSKLTKQKNVYTRARDALENEKIERIVLVDDFNGTGESLSEYVKWIDGECDRTGRARVKVFAYFYCAMEEAIAIKQPASLEVCDVENILKKGISGYNSGSDLTSKIHLMKHLEGNIKKLNPIFSLGFQQSETLYACDGVSTPNNVFPIFWKRNIGSGAFFRPLLNRG